MTSDTVQIEHLQHEGWYNDTYLPVLEDESRTKIFYGSRDSGKSQFIAQCLILLCLFLPYFKCILVRRYANTIKDSQWQTIQDQVDMWKLNSFFTFTKSPLEIRCANGNTFIARGMDNASKLKSVKDPTCFWGEEFDECTEDDYEIINKSLRTSIPNIPLYEFISFNSGSYKHWIPEYFFPPEEEFKKLERKDGLHTFIDSKITNTTILHTCYKHNQFLTRDRQANIERTKDTKPIRYLKDALGLFVDDVEGALWTNSMFKRKSVLPTDLVRMGVALDPAATSNQTSDEAGIVCGGIDRYGQIYLWRDDSRILSPTDQAKTCINLFHQYELDVIVYEKNNGGDWIPTVIKQIDPKVHTQEVWASRGKQTRAEPVVQLYEDGMVYHVGNLPKLEAEMTTWVPGVGDSPNRLDAAVWIVTALMQTPKKRRRNKAGRK